MSDNKNLSEKERSKLMKRLHSHLFWVGEQIPHVVDIEGKDVHLHEIVWEIVNQDTYTEYDMESIGMFINLLSEKEKECELCLSKKGITCDEAKQIFKETAGLMRAIMDLKELTNSDSKKHVEKCVCKNVNTQEWDNLKMQLCPK
jgi:hypothetical protein